MRRKVRRAVTDSLGVVRFNPEQAGLYNLLTLIVALSGETPEQVEARFSGQGYAAVKEETIEWVVAALEPLQQRYREYEANPEVVDGILAESAERAREMAAPVVDAAEEKMGIWGKQRRGAAGHAAL
jgi:tryptophanyl-tRNA synthetase